MEEETFTPEEWIIIGAICQKSQWYPLLEQLVTENNKPQDLESLDDMLVKKLGPTKSLYPSKDAVESLNGYLQRASMPFRIKQITYGENCYRGTIQMRRHVLKKRQQAA